jgi:hypothetical protein
MNQAFRRVLRLTGLFLLGTALIWTGYKREHKLLIMEEGVPVFINRYPKPAVAVFEKQEMKGTLGIKLPAKLQSSVLFSTLFLLLASAILGLYSRSKKVAFVTAAAYLGYMVLCFLLLKLGDMGVDYRLSTGLSHYLEDLFLSPFLILALIVLVHFNQRKGMEDLTQ